MPMETGLIAHPMTGGLDTRTDALSLAPPKLAALDNAVFTTPGEVSQRKGYVRLGNVANFAGWSTALQTATFVTAVDDALIVGDKQGMWTLSPTNDALNYQPYFATIRARRYSSAYISNQDMLTSFSEVARTSRSVCHTFQSKIAAANAPSFSSVDLLTRSNAQSVGMNGTARPRVTTIGDAVLLWSVETATNTLWVQVLGNVDGKGALISTPLSIAADVNVAAPVFDVAVSGGRVLVAYNSTTANTIKFLYVTPTGAVDSSIFTQATAAAPTVLCVAVDDSNGHFSIVWCSSAGNRVDGREFNFDGSAAAASVQIDNASTGYRNVTAAWYPEDTSGVTRICRVFYEIAGATPNLNQVWAGNLAAASGFLWMRHSGLASHAWWHGPQYHLTLSGPSALTGMIGSGSGGVYVILAHESTLQSTYFLARFGQGNNNNVVGRLLPGIAGGVTSITGHLGRAYPAGAGKFIWSGIQRERLGDAATPGKGDPVEFEIEIGASPNAVSLDGKAYVPGMQLMEMSATQSQQNRANENGFLLYPEGITAVASNAGGAMALGTYLYRVYFEWTRDGVRHRSTAISFSAVIGGANNTMTLTIPTLAHTDREGVSIVVFRSTANSAGALLFRCSNVDPGAVPASNAFVANTFGADTVTFVDKLADASITSQEADYLSTDPQELQNWAPPACRLIAYGNGRVFVSGIESDDNEVWYSKTRASDQPVQFTPSNVIYVDPGDGPITALATIGDSVFVFRRRQIYMFAGEGPDNTGFGGAYSKAKLVSDDIGAVDQRSVVRARNGIFFKGLRGIHMIDAGGGISYVGADVEAFNSEAITSAVALLDRNEVRFLSTSRTLVYNYAANAWSNWTIGGISSCVWRGQHVILKSATGPILGEDPTVYTDDGQTYDLVIETAWLRLGLLAGAQRVQALLFSGAYEGIHSPVVQIAYGLQPAWIDAETWNPQAILKTNTYGSDTPYGQNLVVYGGGSATAPATTVYQFEVRPSRQRTQAIKVRIRSSQAQTYGPVKNTFSLSEIAVLAGLFRGPVKLATERKAT